MLDVHEPVKETGIRRTWPNMMTREGAKGMEWNAWSAGNSSEYLCTLPFVRLLSGPMDYTPGVFDIYYERAVADSGRKAWNGDNSQCYIKTTLARQIANWVILYSPLQMACDLIENYEGHPAFRFFRDFDPDCDWSEALDGEPGDFIVVVRRAGERFFLGAGTNHDARTVAVPVDFLDPGTVYHAEIYADDPDAPIIVQPDGTRASDKTAYRILTETVTASDTLDIAMSADGGQAIVLKPVDKTDIYANSGDGWVLETDDYGADYTGVPVANGILGLLPWREPFSVRHIMLNNVSDRLAPDYVNRTVRGINPFCLAMSIDGFPMSDVCDWHQSIDLRKAEHVTEFVADGKVRVRYSFTALRNLPYSMLMDVEVSALDDVGLEFRNMMAVPEDMPAETVRAMLRGGWDIVTEAGASLAGGHSIYDAEPKYGMAVTGVINPERILTNDGAMAGDVLIYTKPLGLGIASTALQGGIAAPELERAAVQALCTLNRGAAEVMANHHVHACTDITGFGVLGHVLEMVEGAGLAAQIWPEAFELLPDVLDLASLGILPSAVYRNRQYAAARVAPGDTALALQDVLFDPQTSGGLMMAVDEDDAKALLADLIAAGVPARAVGRMLPQAAREQEHWIFLAERPRDLWRA